MKSKHYKIISLALICLIVITIIGGKNQTIEATEITATEPAYDVEFNKPSPNPAKIGEDIVISGKIIPKPFKTDIPPKEIVLVLDTSGSMTDPINVNCEKYLQDYCITHNAYGEHSSKCTKEKSVRCKECNSVVDANHKNEMSYKNHTLAVWGDQYWCYDCGKGIGIDARKHLEDKLYKNHTIIDDFCTEHNKQGEHDVEHCWEKKYCGEHNKYVAHSYPTTKISELKKAAVSFVDKMKDVKNLKIAIVTFNNGATIEKDKFFLAEESEKLKDVIGSIGAGGGTNTGEGLRKAGYLLNSKESQANAMKSIVLMSDGLPSVMSTDPSYWNMYPNESELYSTWRTDYKPYLNIEKKSGGQPTFFKWARESVYVNYAKEIAKINRAKKNVKGYSIGYGLDENGNGNLRDIHKALIGETWSDTSQDKEKGFFPTSNGSIENIFNEIADDILNSYNIIDVNLNMKFENKFLLKNGGELVGVNDIKYTKNDELTNINSGKIVYTAEPQPFQFIVNSSSAGESLEIFKEFKIKYKFNNENKETGNLTQSIKVTVESTIPPDINANLISDEKITLSPDEEFELEYKINAADFNYDDSNQIVESDVAIVIDVSGNMADGRKLDIAKEAIIEKLFNNIKLQNKNIKYSIITYNKDVIRKSYLSNDINSLKNVLNNLKPDGKNYSKIVDIIPKVKDVFSKSLKDSKKNVIFVSSGIANDKTVTISDDMKQWNVITMGVTGEKNENSNQITSLKQLHNTLGGKEENFLISNKINNENSDIRNSLMDKVADKILSKIAYKPYKFTPCININLNNNFESVQGYDVDEGKLVVPINEVVYEHQSDGRYVAKAVENIKVKMKIKTNSQGTLNFGELNSNVINYKNLSNQDVSFLIKTPTIQVKEIVKDLSHGLYNNVSSGNLVINDGTVELVRDSNATIAIGATVRNSKAVLAFEVDEGITTKEPMGIYITENNKLKQIADKTSIAQNQTIKNRYEIKLPNSISSETKIIVLYKCKIPNKKETEKSIFTNKIFVNGNELQDKRFNIKTTSEAGGKEVEIPLPDLF